MGTENYIKFCDAAYITKEHDPWVKIRKPSQRYAFIEIVDCQHKDWWYKGFIGFQVMVQITLKNKVLTNITAIRLTNTKIYTGRDFDPKDIMIL